MLPPLPEPLRALLVGRRCELVTTGESSARVERWVAPMGPAWYLKSAAPGGPDSIENEADRMRWMASASIPVPTIIAHLSELDRSYLLTKALPGADASIERSGRSPRSIIAALARALRQLHATPMDGCPFVHPAEARVVEASERVAKGLVDEADFDENRQGVDAAALLEVLKSSHDDLIAKRRSGEAPEEGRVLTHGDYCFPNVILDEADGPEGRLGLSGFVDVGRAGVADPYQDLALATRSIARNLGDAWVPTFFADYGLDTVDRERLEFYMLLDEFF